ncbi:MAG: hypothetical protein RL662_2269 [Bacteroidota bacterium]|jgi:hypothetical protein
MEVIKPYKTYVVENKMLVFFSIILAYLVRLYFCYTYSEPEIDSYIHGYLWNTQINKLLSSNFVSAHLSFLSILALTFYAGMINEKYKIIKSRTYLIYVLPLLFFSYDPVFLHITPQCLSLLLILFCLDIMLGAYQQTYDSGKACNVGFFLGLASLFAFSSLLYLPLFWIAFWSVRFLSFRTFVSSLLGIGIVYWLAFFYFLWQNDLQTFTAPFLDLYPITTDYFEDMSTKKIISLSTCSILLSLVLISYLTNAFREKIQTRAYLSVFYTFTLVSYFAFLFISHDRLLNLYVSTFCTAFLLSYFFTLTDQRWKVYTFYILMGLFFVVLLYLLLL